MAGSRTKNTSRNIVSGVLNRIVMIIFPFINRTAILWLMGAEYTGISTLFSSILEMLNLAELGFNTAIVYCMYKPMAEGDKEKQKYYLTIFRNVYTMVGIFIMAVGILVMPFLRNLINGTYPQDINIYVLYLLYLMNSAVSYLLFAYKESLLLADQRQDIVSNIRSVANILRYFAQFLVLILWHNFYLYVIIQVIGSIISNLMIQWITTKRYPDLLPNRGQKLRIPTELKRQTKALLINRICDTFRNSFDSIIISAFLGLISTTIYSNYYYIYSSIYGTMLVICNAMGASVGNSVATESVQKNYDDMRKFQFLFSYISCVCTVCLVALFQPFMRMWAGEDLMLSEGNMLLFCVYFYLINMCNIRNQYISSTGMWWHLRLNYILEAVGNLILNIILGKLFGVTGILIATIITIFIFNYVLRTHKLFQYYYKGMDEKRFFLDHIDYMMVTTVASMSIYIICRKLLLDGLWGLAVYAVLSLGVSTILFSLAFFKTERFRKTLQFAYSIIPIRNHN